jgi:hypothetical protein
MCAEREEDEKCICTDSIRSVIGSCPGRGHREYYFCPRRDGLFPVELVTPGNKEVLAL